MRDYLDFSNKIVLINGQDRIGEAIAKSFAEHGARVIVNLNKRGPDEHHTGLSPTTDKNIFNVNFEIGEWHYAKSLINEIKNKYGKIDVIINNINIHAKGSLEDIDENDWTDIFRKMIIGIFHIAKAAAPLMKNSGGGSIINLSFAAPVFGFVPESIFQLQGLHNLTLNGAVLSLSRTLAISLTRSGIRINAIIPSTAGAKEMADKLVKDQVIDEEQLVLKRLCGEEEVATVCLFLASQMSSFISGEVISLGYSLKPNMHFF